MTWRMGAGSADAGRSMYSERAWESSSEVTGISAGSEIDEELIVLVFSENLGLERVWWYESGKAV